MKKAPILLVAVALFGLTSCSSIDASNAFKIAKKVNSASKFPVDFLLETSNYDFSSYGHVPGFGIDLYYPSTYSLPEEETIWEYSYTHPFFYVEETSFPDESSSGSYITRLFCSDPDINLFSLNLAASTLEIEKKALEVGFSKSSEADSVISFSSGVVNFGFKTNSYFSLSAEVTNKNNIQY